jgi:hypothetical protein
MRTAQFLVSGLLLLAAVTLLGRLFAPNFPNAPSQSTATFVLLWLVICAFNLWVGVARAGYAVAEELPVFALLFLVPTALAVVARWRGL